VRDGEPPSIASRSRRKSERGEVIVNIVDADVVYANEGTAEYVELKPEGAR
jgi:hypothetical protein